MTPFSIILAVDILLFATLIYVYFGMPRLTLATLLSPIFILFLVWTTWGFPTHFNLFPDLPIDIWCDCGNYTEIFWIDPDYKGNLTYAEMSKDCCCKEIGNFTIEDSAYGNITLPLCDIFRDIN